MIVDVTCNNFLHTMSQMRKYVTTLNCNSCTSENSVNVALRCGPRSLKKMASLIFNTTCRNFFDAISSKKVNPAKMFQSLWEPNYLCHPHLREAPHSVNHNFFGQLYHHHVFNRNIVVQKHKHHHSKRRVILLDSSSLQLFQTLDN